MFTEEDNKETITPDNGEDIEKNKSESSEGQKEGFENLKKQLSKKNLEDKDKKILELQQKIKSLESQIENIKKESNKQILDFVDKKSKEAAEIIEKKSEEIRVKYLEEFESKLKYKYESSFSELVSIVSQFEGVINMTTDPQMANYLLGFKMFLSKFENLLSELEIETIVPKIGDEFNSETMEVTSVKSIEKEKNEETSTFDNKITFVFSKGYRLHDRVIKLASVEVSKISI